MPPLTCSLPLHRNQEHPPNFISGDQEEDSVQHLLITCVIPREVWHWALSLVSLRSKLHSQMTPNSWSGHAKLFTDCRVDRHHCKGYNSLNSLPVLVTWWIWKHRVFFMLLFVFFFFFGGGGVKFFTVLLCNLGKYLMQSLILVQACNQAVWCI
jgi:hypothetical protein